MKLRLAVGVAVWVIGGLGCTAQGSSDGVQLTVFAASSLSSSFSELAAEFEQSHPEVDVVLNVAGSPELVGQVQAGAPADVIATADEATMASLLQAAEVETTAIFAENQLVLAVPAGNPGRVRGLADLGTNTPVVAVCADVVPCGAAARRVAEANDVLLKPDTEEQNVSDVVGKLLSGQVDAGLIYATDLLNHRDDLDSLPLPRAERGVNRYPIAVLSSSSQAAAAEDFVAYVLSDSGQAILGSAGFSPR